MKTTDKKHKASRRKPQSQKRKRAKQPARAKKHRTGHLFKRGDIYWLEYKVSGRRFRQSLHTSDLDQAKIERTRIMAPYTVATEEEILQTVKQRIEAANGKQKDLGVEDLPVITVENAWEAFVKSPHRPDAGPATLRQYKFQYSRFSRWAADNHPEITALRQVTRRVSEDYATDLSSSGLSANTFNKHIRLLMLIFRVLEDHAGIVGNPWAKITRKKQVAASRRELTTEELQAVCGSAEGEMKVLFALGIYTGLRLGDCATLRWAEVDLRRNRIIRIPNKTARSKGEPVRVPIHPVLAAILRETKPTRTQEYVVPKFADSYERSPDHITDRIQAHFVANGIRVHKKGTGHKIIKDRSGRKKKVHTGKRAVVEVGFHSLRHTFVSLCREANTPLAVVEAIVGHSNPAMTRHYTHVGDAAAGQAVAALPAVIDRPTNKRQVVAEPHDPAVVLSRIESILDGSTGKTWSKDKKRVLKLIRKATA